MSRLIDAEALKRAIKIECNPYSKPTIDFESGKNVLKIIDNAPTVEPHDCVLTMFGECSYKETGCSDCKVKDKIRKALEARPKGKWITKPHVHGVTYCSQCDFELKIDDTNYCPNCGARME